MQITLEYIYIKRLHFTSNEGNGIEHKMNKYYYKLTPMSKTEKTDNIKHW
jgi:hypothetical protein